MFHGRVGHFKIEINFFKGANPQPFFDFMPAKPFMVNFVTPFMGDYQKEALSIF